MHSPVFTKAFEASGNIAKRRIVQVGTKDNSVSRADASSDTTIAERPIGICAELGAKTGETVDIHLLGIADCEAGAAGYSNDMYVADMVLPRVPVMRKEYRYYEYPIDESFTVPETRVGRRSRPAMVHFTASEKSAACEDYGLEDAIPTTMCATRRCGRPTRSTDP